MWRCVCAGKIHRATVTGADLHYHGSITIDSLLMEAAAIPRYGMVQINNLSNGATWRTYAVAAPAGSGQVVLNGPPARHFQVGDRVIIVTEGWMPAPELGSHQMSVVFVDEHNRIIGVERHSASATPAADQTPPGWCSFDER